MRAVARLVWSYFMGTLTNRVFTVGGLVLIGVSLYLLTTVPKAGEIMWLAIVGLIAFFVGSSLMPLMFGRLARSHSIRVLPHGRLKLLVSAFVAVIIVSLPVALLTPVVFVAGNGASAADLAKHPEFLAYTVQLAELTYTSALLFAGWLYLAMWFMASQRNMAGFVKGLLVLVVIMFAPAREIRDLEVSLAWNLQQLAVIWIVFGAGFMLWPRYKATLARRNRRGFAGADSRGARGITGREFDLMLGTSNPWLLVAGLAVPTVLATRFVLVGPAVWLYFLTIFSTVAGAIAGEAAGRSRALWLRGNWSREALFAQVERSFWRHNGYVLGALILLMVGIGSYVGLRTSMLAIALPLLVLGTVLSTYLGLMVTRGLRWTEALLGIAVMGALMATAWMVARENADLTTVFVLEVLLAALAPVLRTVARRRWTQIDWMMCRPDRALSVRGG
jgi:hypothetical protein